MMAVDIKEPFQACSSVSHEMEEKIFPGISGSAGCPIQDRGDFPVLYQDIAFMQVAVDEGRVRCSRVSFQQTVRCIGKMTGQCEGSVYGFKHGSKRCAGICSLGQRQGIRIQVVKLGEQTAQ